VGRIEVIPALTGLRFLAAISVAIAHGATLCLRTESSSQTVQTWLATGAGFGMTLFFVLSGFVIHYNYRGLIMAEGAAGMAKFLWARFARLYPLFLLTLLIDLLVGHQFDLARFETTLAALPYYLFLCHSWLYKVIGDNALIYQIGFNVPLTWSISTEWFFYLAYPVICIVLFRLRRPRTVVVLAIGWMIFWTILAAFLYDTGPSIDARAVAHFGVVAGQANGFRDSFFRWYIYFSPYLRIGEFILGCLTAHLYELLKYRPVGGREAKVAGIAFLLVAVSIPIILYATYSPSVGFDLLKKLQFNFGLAPSVAALIFCCARYRLPLARWLSSRSMVALGDASYSIYMIHMLVFYVAALGHLALPINGYTIALLGTRFIFLLALIVLISLGLHATVERPARIWMRGLAAAWTPKAKALIFLLCLTPAILAGGAILLQYVVRNAVDTTERTYVVNNGISIASATYGENCGARRGNATSQIRRTCSGKALCDYLVDVNILGDPVPNCGKTFSVEYSCAPDTTLKKFDMPAEAGFPPQGIQLTCQ
jgi:peptidoglycan/LPS O-acetylase OafA/YrhL